MSRKDVVTVASRVLSVLLTVSALAEMSFLPEFLHSYLHYANQGTESSAYIQYMHHYHLLRVAFLVTRIIGYLLMARWLHKGGAEVEQLLFPAEHEESPARLPRS